MDSDEDSYESLGSVPLVERVGRATVGSPEPDSSFSDMSYDATRSPRLALLRKQKNDHNSDKVTSAARPFALPKTSRSAQTTVKSLDASFDREDSGSEASWESYDPTLSPRLACLEKREKLNNQSSHGATSGPRPPASPKTRSTQIPVKGADALPAVQPATEGNSIHESDWVLSSSDESECSSEKPACRPAQEPLATPSGRATKRVRQSAGGLSGGAHYSLESGEIPPTDTLYESADNRGRGNRGGSRGEESTQHAPPTPRRGVRLTLFSIISSGSDHV